MTFFVLLFDFVVLFHFWIFLLLFAAPVPLKIGETLTKTADVVVQFCRLFAVVKKKMKRKEKEKEHVCGT